MTEDTKVATAPETKRPTYQSVRAQYLAIRAKYGNPPYNPHQLFGVRESSAPYTETEVIITDVISDFVQNWITAEARQASAQG